MNKKQILGCVLLLGGGIFAAIMGLNIGKKAENAQPAVSPVGMVVPSEENQIPESESVQMFELQELKVDDATAQRELEEQNIAKQKSAMEENAQAKEVERQQSEAEALALRQAQVAQEQAKQLNTQNTNNFDAEQEEKKRQQALEAKRKAEQDEKKRQQALEAKRKAEQDEKKRQQAKQDKQDKRQWMVQISLATDQASANKQIAQLRASGYRVMTSPTSKGIRVMVGPHKDKASAEATRQKIIADPKLNMKSAWVNGWVPLKDR